jgi:UDP-3-O-[3-hydroxymyristoyl] N-acetylglucosamine deacetylase/3-hydroxyacyl-[acyl-carrier-protein] dehydratase
MRLQPAREDTGVVFIRTDLPGRPSVRAHIDQVVPSARRTAIRDGAASVEMIEHVMAALAGMRVDNCEIEIDAGECPGCDGSSQAFVEAIDRAGVTEQSSPRAVVAVDRTVSVRDGDALLAAHPSEGGDLVLSYHLDYGGGNSIGRQSYFATLSPDTFRDGLASSRTFLLETEAQALRAAGIGSRATESDLLIFGPGGVMGNALRYPDECARHKVLDMVGDFALLGADLSGFVVAHRSGHKANALLVRKLLQSVKPVEASPQPALSVPGGGTLDIGDILQLLPHRYPFLLVDRVIELEPGKRVVAVKNVSFNEPFFQGHWPGRPIMPGVLILEALAQAAGILVAVSRVERAGRIALIASIDEVKLRRPVVPGDQLRLEVQCQRLKPSAAGVVARAKIDDKVAAEAKIRFVMTEARGAA